MDERAWYIVQTYSGLESAAKRNIESRVESMDMKDLVFNVLVPEVKETIRTKKGDLKEIIVKPYPGYVFIDMIVTTESWFMVRNTPMVTGFLGSSGGGTKPVPLPDEEIAPVLKLCGLSVVKNFAFNVGERVKVTAGNFFGQEATIDSIDMQHEVVKVLINFFGRQTVAELQFGEIASLKQ